MSLETKIRNCRECESMSCYMHSCGPQIPGWKGKFSGIMVVGFNPTEYDCQAGQPYNGKDGEFLDSIFREANVSPDSVYVTYLVKGFKQEGKPGKTEIANCRDKFLIREILKVKPSKIILLGAEVLKAFVKGVSISQLGNKVLAGPHYHIFAGSALSYFRKYVGYESTQCKIFTEELKYFLRHHKVVDCSPIASKDQMISEFRIIDLVQQGPTQDEFEYVDYQTGSEAVERFREIVEDGDGVLGFDIEADGLKQDGKSLREYVKAVGIADSKRAISVHTDDLTTLQFKELTLALLKMFTTRPVVGYNIKFDIRPYIKRIIKLDAGKFDSIQLFDESFVRFLINDREGSVKLKQVVQSELGIPNYVGDIDLSDVPSVSPATLRLYNARDAYYTRELFAKDWKRLTRKQKLLCRKTISGMIIAFAFMEHCGMPFDVRVTARMEKFIRKQIKKLEHKLEDICGRSLNTRSNIDVHDYIKDSGFKTGGLDTTSQGYVSRGKDNLTLLKQINKKNPEAVEFVDTILLLNKFRGMLSKAEGANSYKSFVSHDGRIRPSWWISNARTGRCSASQPNVLNVDRTDTLPEVLRRPENLKYRPRHQFKTVKGRIIVGGDLSQAELRTLACYSKDERLCKAYLEGKDIHRTTAAELMGINEDEVEDWLRQVAKNTNFGKIYLQTPEGLYRKLRTVFIEMKVKKVVTLRECEDFHERWNEYYAGAFEWIEQTKDECLTKGYSESYFGRRRHFDFSDAGQLREAVNHKIQSAAFDITLDIENRIVRDCRFIDDFMLIKNEYDAIYAEVDECDRDIALKKIKQAFKVPVGSYDGFAIVPFESDTYVGRSFATLEKVKG